MGKEDFKGFVRRHPNLVYHVNNGNMTWQKFYEMYDMYGEGNSIWNEYKEQPIEQRTNTTTNVVKEVTNKLPSVGDTSLKDLFNMVKKVDLESVRKGAEGLQKAIALVQDFGTSSKTTDHYQARPLYKHFED